MDKAELIHELPDRKIRTVDEEYTYPSVIRLRRYINISYNRIVLSRRNILKRDNNCCQYCGSSQDLTIDHVVPRSRGGRDSWQNLVAACNECNLQKGDRTPDEANMTLNRDPFRPVHITFFRAVLGSIQENWKPYLYMG